MSVRSMFVTLGSAALLCALVLPACGGAARHDVKEPEKDPWADFKGTYGTSAPSAASDGAKPSPKAAAKGADKASADGASADKSAEMVPDKTDKNGGPAHANGADDASHAAKPSHATIKGESVSTIGMDAFVDASKGAFKSKVVSTKFLVGDKYEQMQVQLKGATVQVIRPTAMPAPDGPAIRSPKARSGELTKTESGWYDEEADVVVVVTAGKKTGAQKALGALLKK